MVRTQALCNSWKNNGFGRHVGRLELQGDVPAKSLTMMLPNVSMAIEGSCIAVKMSVHVRDNAEEPDEGLRNEKDLIDLWSALRSYRMTLQLQQKEERWQKTCATTLLVLLTSYLLLLAGLSLYMGHPGKKLLNKRSADECLVKSEDAYAQAPAGKSI